MTDVRSALFSKMPVPPLLSVHEFPPLAQIVPVPPAGKTHPLALQLLNNHSTQKIRQWSWFRLQGCSAQLSCSEKSGWDPARESQGEQLCVECVPPHPESSSSWLSLTALGVFRSLNIPRTE